MLLCDLVLTLVLLGPGAQAQPSHEELTAFHVPWDPASLTSFSNHRDRIDVLSPQWILLSSADGVLTVVPDPSADALLHSSVKPPKLLPLVANVHDGVWDQAAASTFVSNAVVRDRTVARLVALAGEKHYSGYILDLENLSDESIAALPAFIRSVMGAFRTAKLELWICVPVGPEIWPLADIQNAGAGLLFMAYDQCWDTSTPGPVAGTDWLAAVLPGRLRQLNRDKMIIALAGYGYDWPNGGRGHSITIAEAMQLAHDHGAALRRGRGSDNVTFTYSADGVSHTVWLVDGYSYAKARALVQMLGVRRVALWRLGSEDPGVWQSGKAVNRLPLTPAPLACEPLDD